MAWKSKGTDERKARASPWKQVCPDSCRLLPEPSVATCNDEGKVGFRFYEQDYRSYFGPEARLQSSSQSHRTFTATFAATVALLLGKFFTRVENAVRLMFVTRLHSLLGPGMPSTFSLSLWWYLHSVRLSERQTGT
jgi:hypothetical protein